MSDNLSATSLTASIAQAARCLRGGGVVAFPTETYYGLAVDCFNADAVAHLYALKQRELSKPLLLLVYDEKQLVEVVAKIPKPFLSLMKKYWPGPLTLLFPVNSSVPSLVSAGTGTVGVRISSHPIATLLAKAAGHPITATSANISGRPPAQTSQDVQRMFSSELSWIIDGGATTGGAPSTIVGLENDTPKVIRQGILKLDSNDLQNG